MARLQLGTNEMITILDKLRNSNDSDMTEKERYWTALEILEKGQLLPQLDTKCDHFLKKVSWDLLSVTK